MCMLLFVSYVANVHTVRYVIAKMIVEINQELLQGTQYCVRQLYFL